MQGQEKMAHFDFVMGGQLFLCLCVFYVFLFSIQVSLVLVVGHQGVQTMYQSQCGTPSLYFVFVFFCVFFVFITSVVGVGVGAWAPGCADNVSGTVRHPLIIFTFFTV